MRNKIVIFDMDGTVADCDHRIHFVKDGNRDYDSFYDNMDKDAPIQPIIDLIRALSFTQEYILLAVTGRPITHLRQTQLWLDKYFVPYDAVFMRPENDYRPDTVIKKEILDTIRKEFGEPEFVLDDRQSVVDMWRENGVRCLQVAPGDFDKPKDTYHPGKLVLLVGPSGAGKSTYSSMFKPSCIISSDDIRDTLSGDFQDQSRNKQVFTAIHKIVKARINSGLLTVVDATNIRSADRKAFLDLVPENCEIEYHVIDRPLNEKKRDGGWRLTVENKGVNLIDKHDQVFNSNLKYILDGDGDLRVTVIDAREK